MKVLKWIGIILGSLIVLIAVVVLILVLVANGKLNKTYEVTPTALTIPSDSASIARGAHLADVLCKECHGGALEGMHFFDDMPLGIIYSPNLTSGEGGVGATYTDEDWVRSIRHGVNPDGVGLFVMPSKDYHNMGSEDLGSLIAYMKTIQPMDNTEREKKLGLLGKILLATGAFGDDVIGAAVIDHEAGFSTPPPAGVTPDYGGYLVAITGCTTCHQSNLGGGASPDPNSPVVPNITSGGNLGNWSEAQFVETIRTGKTPEGLEMQDKHMPWPAYARYTDDELKAMYSYLQSVPAVESENGE